MEKVVNKSKQEFVIYNINECADCPFNHSEYDDFALGADTVSICSLAKWKNNEEYIIDIYDSISDEDRDSSVETPNWCPLKNEIAQVFRYVTQEDT